MALVNWTLRQAGMDPNQDAFVSSDSCRLFRFVSTCQYTILAQSTSRILAHHHPDRMRICKEGGDKWFEKKIKLCQVCEFLWREGHTTEGKKANSDFGHFHILTRVIPERGRYVLVLSFYSHMLASTITVPLYQTDFKYSTLFGLRFQPYVALSGLKVVKSIHKPP